MPSVSVIVPIYNKEEFLRQCVDSLLAQALTDFEIVLVDDGSVDSSGSIADSYAAAHKNVLVVHRENGGLGPARNSGIEVASGKYIGFVDADDWVEPSMFERLFLEASNMNADIVVSGHCDVTNGKKTYVKRHPLSGHMLEGQESIDPYRRNLYGHALNDTVVESFPMSVCMSIYRKAMLDRASVRFREILSEDIFFNLDAYGAAYRICFLDSVDYCYRKDHQDSITRTFSPEKLERYITFISTLRSCAEREPEERREDCIMRVKRTALDYARLYMGLIAQSDLSRANQKAYGQQFIDSDFFKTYCLDFPVKTLPSQQRLFQKQLERGDVGSALFMLRFRLALKKGGR
jgi:glycosyltransferase involved in cell wall biosynthesis